MTIEFGKKIIPAVLLLLFGIYEFTVGDGIGWAAVITVFALFWVGIYAIWRRAHRPNASTLNDSLILERIAALDDHIKKLEKQHQQEREAMEKRHQAEIAELKSERDELKLQAKQYADLRKELEEKQVIEPAPAPSGLGIKVLFVAPRSDLPLVDAETEDVQRSGLAVTPVYSPIDSVRLTREIRDSNHGGLWLAGHMDAQGNFLLDKGELLSSSALTSLVRGRFKWVYLNTCQSVYAAQQLQNETDADVICTVVEVPDTDAYRTGSLFANWLVRLGDIRAAYEESRPGANRVFLFLGSTKKR